MFCYTCFSSIECISGHICEGYRLPFRQTPPGLHPAIIDQLWIILSLQLLHSGRVMELNGPPDVVQYNTIRLLVSPKRDFQYQFTKI